MNPSASNITNELLTLMSDAQLGIFVTDQNVDYLYINDQAANILGYTIEELYKIPFLNLTPPDEILKVRLRQFALFTGKPPEKIYEASILHKNGASIPIQIAHAKIIWEGQPARIAAFRDISKIKSLETDFQKLNSLHLLLINNPAYLIAKIDETGKFIFINKTISNFFNKTDNDLIGQDFNTIIHPEDHSITENVLKNLINKSKSETVKQRVLFSEGEKWYSWRYSDITVEGDNKITILAAGWDMSAQHANEEALKRSEKKYRERFYSQLDPFNVSSLDGELLEYNEAFGKMAGFDPEKDYTGFMLSKNWPNKEDRAKLINELITNGYVQNYPIKWNNIKNKPLHLYVNSILIKDDDGKPLKAESTYFDSTKQTQIHERLLNTNLLLDEKVKDRTRQLSEINKTLKNQNSELIQSGNLIQLQNKQLEHKNIALHELMLRISIEKGNIAQNVNSNITNLILPSINKLKSGATDSDQKLIEIIEHNLENITSSFGSNVSDALYKLSPREVEICNYIKNGIGSKEISSILNISETTVISHRNHIRRKLNIHNTNINLTTYLNSL